MDKLDLNDVNVGAIRQIKYSVWCIRAGVKDVKFVSKNEEKRTSLMFKCV